MMEKELYAIEDSRYKELFDVLVATSENLDKNNFLDSAYFVDDKLFPHKGAKDVPGEEVESSSSRKGKMKATSSKERESDEEDIVISLDDEVEERRESPTPMHSAGQMRPPAPRSPVLRAHIVPTIGVDASGVGGSSASQGDDNPSTPHSGRRVSKKQRAGKSSADSETNQLLQKLLEQTKSNQMDL